MQLDICTGPWRTGKYQHTAELAQGENTLSVSFKLYLQMVHRAVASMLETLRTRYLHPLDGLDGVVSDVDIDANGLTVVVQLERE